MQNREVPVVNLPIFFSSLRLAEAGRTCPEVRGGETGRGTRATVRGTQKTEPRVRGAGDAGAGPRVRVRVRDAEHGKRGRGARDAKRGTRGRGRGHGGTGCRTQDAGRRTQNTGYWPRAAEHGKRGHEVQKTEDAGTGCRTQNTGYWPRAAEHGKRGHGAQETGHKPPCMDRSATAYTRPAPQQPAGAVHSRAPSAAGRRYLSRVRIRITPLPPRTPYMLLPRCTSTDLTS